VSEEIAKHTNSKFDVVSNPEFLKEGVAVEDFMKPDRIVVGTNSEKAKKIMEELYEPFIRQGNPIIFMDERSAEITKYAANAYLATRISFMNEIANICDATGANVDMVRKGMGTDSRIGKRFLFAGMGYGGSCFPKDVKAIAKTASDHGYDFKILESVMKVNRLQRGGMMNKVLKFYNNDLKGKKLAIWGLAFKPNTDDIREAPALYIIDELLKAGASIAAFDPEAMQNVKHVLKDKIDFGKDEYEVLKEVDALIIATEWSIFRTPDFKRMEGLMKEKVIFDGRNLYNLKNMEDHGFYYYSIGRQLVNPLVKA